MKTSKTKLVELLCAETLLMSAATGWCANTQVNPFQSIVARNVFALTHFVAQPVLPPPLIKPAAAVRLTGLISIPLPKRALLEITEAPGKPIKKLILAEGESSGDISVLSIDMTQSLVTIKNGTVVTNVTLGASPPAFGPATRTGVAGVPVPAWVPQFRFAPPMQSAPGDAFSRGNIVVAGGSPDEKTARPFPPSTPMPRLIR